MYLKSIEVQGFKSFANKITFEFHDGITGIVGPNGSGKSNVADAVRWVLGEQSAKQLRGSKMEDVIFAGTQLRKPQGFAYVAITLDNADHKLPIEYDEVTVSRRVYRSGESEYMLNGNSCRLKDVQELLMDTGIGKEGYSIIGQGQIDKILSGKPEERRELFDEAAGIVKYKKRKSTAERQLEEEKLNLSRITDILSEIEKQLGPLEKQQAVAKEYLKFKDELKRYEVNTFLIEQEAKQQSEQSLSEKISIVRDDLAETEQKYNESKTEYERLEAEIDEISDRLSTNNERKNEIILEQKQYENDIRLLNEQISSIHASESHYLERKGIVAKECEEKREELRLLQKEKKELDSKRLQTEDSISENEEAIEAAEGEICGCENEIENRKADIIRLLEQNGTIKTNAGRYKTIREQNQIKKATLTQKVLKNENEKSVAEKAAQQATAQFDEINTRISEKLAALRADEAKLVSVREEQNRIRDEYEELQRECIRQQSRAESLRNISERYDGYGNGIRRVMEQRDHEKGILGVVADIFTVERRYETAIETALGGNIQNIVTDTEQTAKKMIAFLKQNKAGRVTFLPLDAISAKKTDLKDVTSQKGVIGIAADLVSSEAKYSTVITFLLGRIVVADTIENALALAKKYNYSLRIVTLEGEQLNPGGSISGGAYKNASNLLGRRREVEEAEEQVEHLKEKLSAMEERRETLRNSREQLNASIVEKKEEISAEQIELNTARLKKEQLQNEAKSQESSYDEIHRELLEIENQDRELTEMSEKLEQEQRDNEEESRHNESCIEDCTKTLSEFRASLTELQKKNEELKLEYSELKQKISFLSENIGRIDSEISKLLGEQDELQGENSNARNAIGEKEDEIENKKNALESIAQMLVVIEKEAGELGTRRESAVGRHKACLAERENFAECKNELDKDLYRLNDKIEKVREQIEEQCAYMFEEYAMTISDAEALKEDGFDNLNQNKRRIGEIKNRIKGLGSVNVNAIEEYKECLERFTFLDTQRNDLVKAGETLTAMISELDEKMRTQFTEKFAEIRDEFAVVFAELFGGGKGTIELQEDEDILTAGIRINAQPPGKKLQNMMQLSGGEKALTAISLLFAIQNLKPSPFCLLDEIEAALDDSNVKRYAGYLHKLTDNTQFIVITHRRGTMAAADTLYGITMQEKGVSTLVSVNLIEDKLDQ